MKRLLFILAIAVGCLWACDKSDTEPEALQSEIRKGSSKTEDDQLLTNLYLEILGLSSSYSCLDETEWKWTPIGSKACGGPTGYIAYSTNLDVSLFLSKVAFYTHQQDAYNIKWEIISDCSIPPEPIAIMCENGSTQLVY